MWVNILMKYKKFYSKIGKSNSLKQFLKYIIVGCINNIAYYGFFLFFMYVLALTYYVATPICYILSIILGYFLNSFWAFEAKKICKKELITYIIVYLVSLTINLLILKLEIGYFKIEPWIAQLIATPIIVFFNFFAIKFIVFKI